MSAPLSEDAGIPTVAPTAILSYAPVRLPMPGRTADLLAKVSAPVTGTALPVILLSHGHGRSHFLSSLRGYGPLVDFWSARGFVVVQPTHLDSTALGLREADHPDAPLYTRSRVADMRHLLDHLDVIEETVPGLAGRVDRNRVAAVGHSLGGHTVGVLCGQAMGPTGAERAADQRVKAGVLLAAPGNGADLAGAAAERYRDLIGTDFRTMTTPALVVAGDRDVNPMFSARADWRSDAYRDSPSPKSLLTLFGAEHALGGVAGWDAAETSDESPERVAALRALVWAYLRTHLYAGDTAWTKAVAALDAMSTPVGSIQSR